MDKNDNQKTESLKKNNKKKYSLLDGFMEYNQDKEIKNFNENDGNGRVATKETIKTMASTQKGKFNMTKTGEFRGGNEMKLHAQTSTNGFFPSKTSTKFIRNSLTIKD